MKVMVVFTVEEALLVQRALREAHMELDVRKALDPYQSSALMQARRKVGRALKATDPKSLVSHED